MRIVEPAPLLRLPATVEVNNANTQRLPTGQYLAEIYNPQSNTYNADPTLSITITVDEIFDNDHRVVSQKGSEKGRFTFSSADAGQHKMCFTPDSQNSGWLSGGSNPVKLTLDMAIGETNQVETEDKGKMDDLVQRVKNLNSRLVDVRREQVFQRVSHAVS